LISMENTEYIRNKLNNNKKGVADGIFSICSANKYVLEASIRKAKIEDINLLIETTSNQVNQFGGYTGTTPDEFIKYMFSFVRKLNYPSERIIFGGDHLGPYPWRNQPAEDAMVRSEEMVREYVVAGYEKIHIDASMYCLDDNHSEPINKKISAERAARICTQAESASSSISKTGPLYVIGTEVPPPGGQLETGNQVNVTSADDVEETLEVFRKVFIQKGLESAWNRVVAVVVQPGVEFGENDIIDYDHQEALHLKRYIENIPGIVFEAHSTDYQIKDNLKKMVEDHFAILKVGPALTFRFREAVFALHKIEEQLFKNNRSSVCSNLVQVITRAMNDNPAHWKDYYPQDENLNVVKLFGFSDRIRYYWNIPEVVRALDRLLYNLRDKQIPLSLISQYFPRQFSHIRMGKLKNEPEQLIIDHIIEVLDDYCFACSPNHNS
jgi:D-tagatose-1,6-bisphosphate aldolase subunit GatZ/KbaZ